MRPEQVAQAFGQTFNPGILGGWPKTPLGPWVHQVIFLLTGEPLGSSGSQASAETNETSPTLLVAAARQTLSVANITHETEPAEFGEPLMSQTLSSDTPQSLHNHKCHTAPLSNLSLPFCILSLSRSGFFFPLKWRMETSATGFSVLNSVGTGSHVMAVLGCQTI